MPIAITNFQDGTTADFPLDILFSGSEEQRLFVFDDADI
jgi:hypothetical protein